MFKMSREQLYDFFMLPINEQIHPDDLVRVLRMVQHVFHHPEELLQFTYRMVLPRKKDEYIWLMSTIYGRKLADGSVLQYIASLDITAEREEQEKQAAIFTHTNALLERVLATTQTALFW